MVNGEPKLPSASTLQYGEIAINYAVGGETLSIKNSTDEVVEFISKNKIANNFYAKTEADGKFITGINVNGAAATVTNGVAEINVQGGGGSTLPSVTAADNGKVLMVVDGAWVAVMPATVYTGTDMPLSSTGNDGDIYLQTS